MTVELSNTDETAIEEGAARCAASLAEEETGERYDVGTAR